MANHSASPNSKGKLQLKWILHRDRPINPSHRTTIKLARTPSALTSTQDIQPSLPIFRQPVIDTGTTESKVRNNLFGAFPSLNSCNGTLAKFGKCFVIQFSTIMLFHASMIHNLQTMSIPLCTD